MNIKYCPICKSELLLRHYENGSSEDFLYCKDKFINHFRISDSNIRYSGHKFYFEIIKSKDIVYIRYVLNEIYNSFELSKDFNIYYDKVIEILETDCSVLKLKMVFNKIDNLLIFQ